MQRLFRILFKVLLAAIQITYKIFCYTQKLIKPTKRKRKADNLSLVITSEKRLKNLCSSKRNVTKEKSTKDSKRCVMEKAEEEHRVQQKERITEKAYIPKI